MSALNYNPENREQIHNLKDGRTVFKTHNGFKCFLEDKKGKVIPVTEAYYAKAARLKK